MNWEGKCIMKNSVYHSHYSHFCADMGQLLCGLELVCGPGFQTHCPSALLCSSIVDEGTYTTNSNILFLSKCIWGSCYTIWG